VPGVVRCVPGPLCRRTGWRRSWGGRRWGCARASPPPPPCGWPRSRGCCSSWCSDSLRSSDRTRSTHSTASGTASSCSCSASSWAYHPWWRRTALLPSRSPPYMASPASSCELGFACIVIRQLRTSCPSSQGDVDGHVARAGTLPHRRGAWSPCGGQLWYGGSCRGHCPRPRPTGAPGEVQLACGGGRWGDHEHAGGGLLWGGTIYGRRRGLVAVRHPHFPPPNLSPHADYWGSLKGSQRSGECTPCRT